MKQLAVLILGFFIQIVFCQGKHVTELNIQNPSAKIICLKSTPVNYTLDDLKNSDWNIYSEDAAFTIVEFKLSILPNNSSSTFSEIKGSVIPEEYRDRILKYPCTLYLDSIVAKSADGRVLKLKPVTIKN